MKTVYETLMPIFDRANFALMFGGDTSQQVRLHTVGYKLDNAFGEYVSMDALERGYQEIVAFVEGFVNDSENPFIGVRLNMACILAEIRRIPDTMFNADAFSFRGINFVGLEPIISQIKVITENCRSSMHEPDEQEVFMAVRTTMNSLNGRLHSVFTLRNVSDDDNPVTVEFTDDDLTRMLALVYLYNKHYMDQLKAA